MMVIFLLCIVDEYIRNDLAFNFSIYFNKAVKNLLE